MNRDTQRSYTLQAQQHRDALLYLLSTPRLRRLYETSAVFRTNIDHLTMQWLPIMVESFAAAAEEEDRRIELALRMRETAPTRLIDMPELFED